MESKDICYDLVIIERTNEFDSNEFAKNKPEPE